MVGSPCVYDMVVEDVIIIDVCSTHLVNGLLIQDYFVLLFQIFACGESLTQAAGKEKMNKKHCPETKQPHHHTLCDVKNNGMK